MVELRRELGLFEATVYGVGLILGAGIYAVLGEATGLAGESVFFAFVIASFVGMLTGLSYSELSSMYPKEEADYIYVRSAFDHKKLSEVTAIFRIFVGIVSAAAVALAFGGYLSSFIPAHMILLAITIIVISSAINFYGIRFSSKINILFTAIEVLGLLIVIWMGAGSWGQVDVLQAPRGLKGIFQSAFLIFFAYIGFESLVNITEETREASKKIPQAIIISIVVTTVLYILVSISAVAIVDWQALGQSNSPLALVALEGWGPEAFTVITVIALFATMNTVLITLISTSRILYGVSKDEYHFLPAVFSKVHRKTRTPHVAVLSVCLLSILFTLLGDIGAVAGLANLFLLIVFVLVNAALLKLRYRYPGLKRGFKAPLNWGNLSFTALAGFITCLALIIFYLIQNFI